MKSKFKFCLDRPTVRTSPPLTLDCSLFWRREWLPAKFEACKSCKFRAEKVSPQITTSEPLLIGWDGTVVRTVKGKLVRWCFEPSQTTRVYIRVEHTWEKYPAFVNLWLTVVVQTVLGHSLVKDPSYLQRPVNRSRFIPRIFNAQLTTEGSPRNTALM